MKQALRAHDVQCHLHLAEDGDKAAAFVEHLGSDIECPDLALLDLNLPKREGHEILHLIRNREACVNLPVIIVTSSDSPRDRARSTELGANRYFCKPAEWDKFMQLGAIVKELLEQQGQSSLEHS